MNKLLFYPRLAINNLRKNKSTYFPYMISCILVICMFYVMHAISVNVSGGSFLGAAQMTVILMLGIWVVGLFAILLLFYTNSFLIKRRKRELGLYSILGMEKRHIAGVLMFENLFTSLFSLVMGIAAGILLSRLAFLVLLNILGLNVQIPFSISPSSILFTITLFGLCFLLTSLSNLRQIHISNPLSLLQGSRQGEKEPKTHWLLAIIAFAALGGGYYLSLTTNNPMDAIGTFFIAALLVIVGTYALFIAGSVVILKMLRANKRFYYRPRNFISVSGMIYRMKQNAAGLASICILSTIVLVILSSTVCLYLGEQEIITLRYPQDVIATAGYAEGIQEAADEAAKKAAAESGVTIEKTYAYPSAVVLSALEDDVFSSGHPDNITYDRIYELRFISLSDFNRLEGQSQTLQPGEVLVTDAKGVPDTFVMAGQTFTVKDRISCDVQVGNYSKHMIIVLPDETSVQSFASSMSGNINSLTYKYGVDVNGSVEDVKLFSSNLAKQMADRGIDVSGVTDTHDEKLNYLSIFGTLFFIGIFLGALFMMATVLIIYYKQVSEGYDDRDRFEIMQKVGLSKQEVRSTIHKQILMIFFLPLLLATLHIAMAFNSISQMLTAFSLDNSILFLLCTIGTILVFAVVYGIVYALTARTYYKIVQHHSK